MIEYVRLNPQTLLVDSLGSIYRKIDNGKILEAANEFYTVLTVDKPTITADGMDTATITATLYNYLDQQQAADNSTVVMFELNGTTQTVTATNGVASITFNSAVPGTFSFSVSVPDSPISQIGVIAQ